MKRIRCIDIDIVVIGRFDVVNPARAQREAVMVYQSKRIRTSASGLNFPMHFQTGA